MKSKRVVQIKEVPGSRILLLACGHSVKKPSLHWWQREDIQHTHEPCPQCGGYRK